MDEDVEYEEEIRERRRSRQPRFGSFVTIAAALLMLFGAASRMGKVEETASLFGIDGAAREQIRRDELRHVSIANIGARPADANSRRERTAQLPIRPDAQPPLRGDFEIPSGNGGRVGLSSVAERGGEERQDLDEFSEFGDLQDILDYSDSRDPRAGGLRPPSSPNRPEPQEPRQTPHTSTYVVVNGDTLAKIARKTLGDSNRWREILRANPAVDGGKLRVGMELTVPN